MIIKRLLGEILSDMGFIKRTDLEEALKRQRKIFEEKMLPERLKRDRLIAEARMANASSPLLGEILLEMGAITKEQLEDAVSKQDVHLLEYRWFDKEKLGIALETGSMINSSLNLAEVLSHIMNQVNRLTDSVASTLMLLDDQTGELVFSVPTGPKADQLTDVRIPPGKGIAGWVAQHEQTVLVPNAREDERFYAEIDRISGIETKSILCVPLKAKTRLIGVLEIINKKDGSPFNDEDAALLSMFASHAAMAIENARLYSELKQKFEEEIQLQKRISDSEKFKALGQMAAGVAHDFNNLLMGIQGNTSLILLETDSNFPYFERLKQIEEAVLRGSELTSQLLGFARGGKYEVKPINLNELIQKSANLFGQTKREILIHLKLEPDVYTVDADQNQIEQVLFNLYMNAWQAMPGGGEIVLRSENVTLEEDDVTSSDIGPGRYAMISVTDTGIGMDEETQRRIFDPFFTTKEMARGTGLGLASAFGIIRNHGGMIDVKSTKGKGTTFRILLPASGSTLPEQKPMPDGILRGDETILLVDDEEMITNIGKEMLEKLGYKVLTAVNGEEALRIFSEKKGEIEMVILDMVMPVLGGGETFDRIREIDPMAKVLLSSGYSIDGQATEILERGCNGFIQKPFNLKDLSVKLREIMDARV